MPPKSNKARRILARTAPELFVGRGELIRELSSLASARAGQRQQGMILLAAPHSGLSELLRQTFDELFKQKGGAAPIYFAFSQNDHVSTAAARRFLHTFLTQLVAHRRDDPTLVNASPTLRSLLDLVAPSDFEWVERLIHSFERAVGEADERALVRVCLSAPQQAAERGARTLVMLDDVHLVERLRGEVEFGPELAQAALHSGSPFVLGGLRRRVLAVLNGAASYAGLDGLQKTHLACLRESDARALVEALARKFEVPLSEETRDLLVEQLGACPYFIMALMEAARDAGKSLKSFREFQELYVDELMGGRLHRRLSAVLEELVPTLVQRRVLLRLLHESASSVGGKTPAEVWLRRLGVDAIELERVMRLLHTHELASFHATYVEATPGLVWRDFLGISYRLHVAVEPRALVVADTLVEALKRAPQTMARHYRREAALNLGRLLRRFNSQRVPASLLHFDRFARVYRGISPEEIAAGLDAESDLVRLPQVVHSASAASFHPPALQFCDEERCAVAHGFDSATYADANEVVWIAAEVESKLEAGRALVELWLDRLAQLAQACGFERVRFWLVSPEGFSTEAIELLNEREAYGSSRQMLELLTARLGAAAEGEAGLAQANEFAIEIPMGEDTELIAAHTVEQIARRMDFEPEAINQIKTALVEACINAAEHSFSPERKIYNRFRVEDDKLVITVSSRGLSLPASFSENGASFVENNGRESVEGARGRRGWGLKLIRTLMDDVEFERVDDGTRLRMTKYLRR